MPSLILFCKSPRAEPYINVMAHATSEMKLAIDSIVFALYEMPGPQQEELQGAIATKLHEPPLTSLLIYEKAKLLTSYGSRAFDPIERTTLNAFVERYNYGVNYFDLTGLPKEDLILISSVLLANGVKNIRFFHPITLPAKLLHEYPEKSMGVHYSWINLHEIADEFLGFFERREGKRLALAVFISLVLSGLATVWLCVSATIKITEIPVTFFSLEGSVFSFALPVIYWIRIRKDLRDRLRRLRIGGTRH